METKTQSKSYDAYQDKLEDKAAQAVAQYLREN
jgi:hypothetical protein